MVMLGDAPDRHFKIYMQLQIYAEFFCILLYRQNIDGTIYAIKKSKDMGKESAPIGR